MDTNELTVTANDLTTELSLNLVAALDFVLMGTDLTMAFAKMDGVNTFVILPTPSGAVNGITVEKMIEDIKTLIKGYDPKLDPADLTSDSVTGAIEDVDKASQTKEGSKLDRNIDYKSIEIYLNQAFLLLRTGYPTEYAFDIRVNLKDLFPQDVSFINVKDFHLSIWNTPRANILSRLSITDINAMLAENNPA